MLFAAVLIAALALYGAANLYVFLALRRMLPRGIPLRPALAVLYWAVAFAYLAARLLERRLPVYAADAFVHAGALWLALLVYLLMALLAVDLLRAANRFVPFFPVRAQRIAAAGAVALALLVVAAGRINAGLPRLRELDLRIEKASPIGELRIALATDMHMGTIVSNGHLERVVELINGTRPDIVLFAGDLVDEDIAPVMRKNLGDTLLKLESKYGSWGITGNHEYIGGAEEAVAYLEAHGVTMLRDRAIAVDGAFVLAGREDLSRRRFSGTDRAALEELLSGADASLPIILMDHQPADLSEAERNGVDLQVSGHTHNGQLWPFDRIVDAMYELGFGYLRKGKTHYYVSCGVGTWGPPVRTSSRPEVVLIRLRFGR